MSRRVLPSSGPSRLAPRKEETARALGISDESCAAERFEAVHRRRVALMTDEATLIAHLRRLNDRAGRRGAHAAQREWATGFRTLVELRGVRLRAYGCPRDDASPPTIADLARETGVATSTAYRRLESLADDGGAP